MNIEHEKIWKNILTDNETVLREFGVARGFRILRTIHWSLMSFVIWILSESLALGVALLVYVMFKYLIYEKHAHLFALTERRIIVRTGFFSVKTHSIDYTAIAEVSVEEPFFERTLTKSGDLVIARTGTVPVRFSHVNKPNELKKEIDTLRSRGAA